LQNDPKLTDPDIITTLHSKINKRAKFFPSPKPRDREKMNGLKYSPARFLNTKLLIKRSPSNFETKFVLPSIHSDLELIKKINKEEIDSDFQQNKMISNYYTNCRTELNTCHIVRRVRFQLA
jgi:hypothetical protein